MDNLRSCYTPNVNIPGVTEYEHPNKFLAELRPVEEFRHTPIIPITETIMKRH